MTRGRFRMTKERSWWQENAHDGKKRLRGARGGSGGQEELRGARRPHGDKRKLRGDKRRLSLHFLISRPLLAFRLSWGLHPSFVILPPTLVTLSGAKGLRLHQSTIPQTDLSVKHGMRRERGENGLRTDHDCVGLGEGGVRRVIVKVPCRLLRARSRWIAALISPKCVKA